MTNKLGRKPHSDPPKKVTLSIPSSLVDWLDLYTYDPVAQKPSYGGRSKILTGLLREYKHKVQGTIGETENKAVAHLKEHGDDLTNSQIIELLDRATESTPFPNTIKLLIEQLVKRLGE